MLVMAYHTRFLQLLEVPEGTSNSKAEKIECERKVSNHTTLTTDSLG